MARTVLRWTPRLAGLLIAGAVLFRLPGYSLTMAGVGLALGAAASIAILVATRSSYERSAEAALGGPACWDEGNTGVSPASVQDVTS